jgi:hypothetical protein
VPGANLDCGRRAAARAARTGEGMSILIFCPMTSSAVYPKRRSAAGLNDSTRPRSSMVMIPSTAVCRMACVPHCRAAPPRLAAGPRRELGMLLVQASFGDL